MDVLNDIDKFGWLYILDGKGNPVSVAEPVDPAEWAEAQARCDKFRICTKIKPYEVSTVFVCVNMGVGHPPLLWETMIFWVDDEDLDEFDGGVWHYATREEAVRGHESAVALVNKFLSRNGLRLARPRT